MTGRHHTHRAAQAEYELATFGRDAADAEHRAAAEVAGTADVVTEEDERSRALTVPVPAGPPSLMCRTTNGGVTTPTRDHVASIAAPDRRARD